MTNLNLMSPHRLPNGPHKGLKIRRKTPVLRNGVKTDSCDWIELYTTSGRVLTLNTDEDNILEETKKPGDSVLRERRVLLTPNQQLRKMVIGDYLSIPWGIRPNVYQPLNVPDYAGPQIWLKTPSGPKLLTWNGSIYASDTLTLSFVNSEWCLSGEVAFCIGSNFSCLPYPEGYAFLKTTGPLADFKIVRIDEELDHLGRTSYYDIFVEFDDRRDFYVQ